MTSSVSFRFADPQDAAALLEIYAPYVLKTAVTFENEVPTVSDFAERIRHTLTEFPYIVALHGDTPVGYAYASSFHERAAYAWTAETSIYLHPDHRGAGIGSMLYDRLEHILSIQHIHTVYACVACTAQPDAHLTNASTAFHLARGYREIGSFRTCAYKFGMLYDMVYLEKQLCPIKLPLPDRLCFPAVRQQAERIL